MTNHGDDCYFFYYSTCTKGDSCPFRHCEAAMGNETVCNLWQEGRCFRTVCKFRHMEITKNRKEIPCYWEHQPAGCQKPHCAFFHEKPRYIEGIFVPPNRHLSKNDEQVHEEPTPPPAAPLPTPANPQIRGVMKTECQEPVPSPTHPPVVINPADDDEDEDDQFSEEGEDSKVGLSPRKLPKSDDSMNFGVSTLEEIRLRKALKASMKRAGYPIQSSDTPANGEKENIQSFLRPALYDAGEDTGRPRPSVVDRLGRKVLKAGGKSGEGFQLKRRLAERLGRVVAEDDPSVPPEKALKPIKQRLGLPASPVAPTQTAEANMESKKAPEQIHIKTLEEIRQEKAAKTESLSQIDDSSVVAQEITKTVTTKGIKSVKRDITIKDDSIGHIKTFSEVVQSKKRKQEEQNPSSKKIKQAVEKNPCESQGQSKILGCGSEAANVGEVRVKTLEEIRREKAVRMQTLEAGNKKSSETEETGAIKPRLLRVNKLASQKKHLEGTEKPVKIPTAVPETSSASSTDVKVKTFEEIMREKRLRKQEMEDQARTSTEASPPEKQTNDISLKRKASAEISLVSLGSSLPPCNTPDSTSTQRFPIRKPIPLKSKTASPLDSSSTLDTTAAFTTVTSFSVRHSEPENHLQSLRSPREVSDKKTSKASVLSPTKQVGAAPPGSTDGTPITDTTLNNNQRMSTECTVDNKVRPKLNVKPSFVKHAVQVKPGQKRKGAVRSAIAAVKPLNSTSTVQEPMKKMPRRDREVFQSSSVESHLSSDLPHTPSTLLGSDSSSSHLKEELQMVPVFKQSPSKETRKIVSVAAPREACTVPQSPILKTPIQVSKPRRQSTGVSRTNSTSSAAASISAVDDFEELISEFTGEHLEDEVDPGIGEDDLLQELSEMIDS